MDPTKRGSTMEPSSPRVARLMKPPIRRFVPVLVSVSAVLIPMASAMAQPSGRQHPDHWRQIPGCAKRISISHTGQVFVLGCDDRGGGNSSLFQWTGENWDRYSQAGTELSALGGDPWVVAAGGRLIGPGNQAGPWGNCFKGVSHTGATTKLFLFLD